jgi:hypothetical protein
MVEEIFSEKVKDSGIFRRREIEVIEVKDPIEKLFADVKKAIEEYKRSESKEIKVGIFESTRNIGFVN